MLDHLSIRNFVLIDNLDLDFKEGFTAITGETGAGKSIILSALSLVLGSKAYKEDIRSGYNEALISATFSRIRKDAVNFLKERGIEIDSDEVIVRRKIKSNGKSQILINGQSISQKECEELGLLLVDISSQHAHQTLLKEENHRVLLDDYLSLDTLVNHYKEKYLSYKETEKKLKEVEEEVKKNLDEEDYMRFCLEELEKVKLKEGEEESLKEEINIMNSSEFLRENIESAENNLKESISLISSVYSSLLKSQKKDSSLSSLFERVDSLYIESQDINDSLRDYLNSISFNSWELEEKNSRLSVIQKTKRKYGGTVEIALKKKEEFERKLREVENFEDIKIHLNKEVLKLKNELNELADSISKKRAEGAKKLELRIQEYLHKLGMPKAEFYIKIETLENLTFSGKDKVQFLLSANVGEKIAPLEDVSSGGELSRIMLALKVAIQTSDNPMTLVFDEIDSGVGGKVATFVADELKELGKKDQVIAITHLPQIAVKAKSHFLVVKKESDGRTISTVKEIEGDEKIKEIARLLSGDSSSISMLHAKSLLEV